MMNPRVLWSRLTELVLWRRREDRLTEEIQTHLDLLTDEFFARGMQPSEARLAARKSFGGVDQTKEMYRDQRGLPMVESISQDVRNAWRSLGRTPTFTIVSIVTLALAIGANAGIGSLLNALLLRNLPVRDPSTLVQVGAVSPTGDELPLTYTMFQALSRDQQVFSSVMGWWGTSVLDVRVDGAVATAAVFAATGNLFDELGVQPLHGRLLVASDMSLMPPAAETVAVVGHRFWKRYLHEDPTAVGGTIRIGRTVFTIVGVAQEAYSGLRLTIEPDITIPLAAVPLLSGRAVDSIAVRPTEWIRMVGRLKPDISLAQARAQIEALWPAIRDTSLSSDATTSQRDRQSALRAGVGSMAHGSEPALRAQFTWPLLIVFGIAAVVLCIACVNLASLSLARAVARSHEIATRLALGGTRWRVSRQFMVEGLLLSLAGGVGGVVAALWASQTLSGVILADLTVPTAFNPAPDVRVIATTFVVTFAVGAIFSLAPCWWVVRQRASQSLRVSSRTVAGSGRFGTLLVATQIALAVVLLVHAGLFIRTLQSVHSIDTGIEANDVFVAFTAPLEGGYDDVDNDTYYPSLIDRVRSVAGVEYASVALFKPGASRGAITTVASAGAPTAPVVSDVTRNPVAPEFLRALGVTMREGRDFSFHDNSRSQKVAVISRSLAARLYPGRTPIGERIRIGSQPQLRDVEIVGVAADSRLFDPKNENLDAVYVPALQDPENASFKCLVIRGRNVPMAEIERAVSNLGREYVSSTDSFNYIVGRTLLCERMTAALAGFFGVLALVLSAIGIYGLMSYTVSQRRREAGIRLALGEQPFGIIARVLLSALSTAALGMMLGLPISLATVGLARVLLFGIAPRDPAAFIFAAVGMAVIAIAASILPAVRLGRVDPLSALRED